MTHTNTARVKLLFLPVVFPLTLLFNLVIAVATGLLRAVELFCNWTADDIRDSYMNIYRPAVYGHVDDYPEVK